MNHPIYSTITANRPKISPRYYAWPKGREDTASVQNISIVLPGGGALPYVVINCLSIDPFLLHLMTPFFHYSPNPMMIFFISKFKRKISKRAPQKLCQFSAKIVNFKTQIWQNIHRMIPYFGKLAVYSSRLTLSHR